jgi:dihydroorotase/N-acyl-D-amino-acid deacylase
MNGRIVLRGGTLFDGTGAPPVAGDVLIESDRIAACGVFETPLDAAVVDCIGLAVAPGFIDSHSHSDLQILENRREKLMQGVTTEVVGNCGFSAYPAPYDRRALHAFADGIFCGDGDWGWRSAAEYLSDARKAEFATVCSLAGHGTLRIAHAGNRLGPLPEKNLDAMERTLSECLTEGACGLSSGLMYSPGASAPFEELERLCRVVARHGKVYATHMRDYSGRLLEAIDEQLELARRTGCRLQISHLQAAGQRSWAMQQPALERVERARAEGIDVEFDCYPYTRGATVMTQILPQWTLEGGIDGLLGRLATAAERSRIAAETESSRIHEWTELFISAVASDANQRIVGDSIQSISEQRGQEPVETVLDLLIEERGAVNVLEINQSDANLRQAISHPLASVISDGFYVKGRPHPRLYGTFPHLLGGICRDRGWLSLTQGIHKITGQPARRFGIEERGRLVAGYFADITIFDPASVGSPASYENPCLPPLGIRYVFRNGRPLISAQV